MSDPTPQQIESAIRTLQWLAEHPGDVEDPIGRAVARAYKKARRHRRAVAARDRAVVPPSTDRRCYVCQTAYPPHDGAYPALCPGCAADQMGRRNRRTDLRGRTAVVTGARIKIGFETALKFLRDGAAVVATTRFPVDAASRFAAQPDFAHWAHRLTVYALDLRDLRAVERFAAHLARAFEGIDILVNNAAQTIRRPPEFYRALFDREAAIRPMLPASAAAMVKPDSASRGDLFAIERTDGDRAGLAADGGTPSSWHLPLERVETAELAEVMLVNTMAPFALCSLLEPLLRRSKFPDRYVVNVTSVEGQFDRGSKPPAHPHTNMAKAALNMLTRTVADRCAESGIYVNSVDPGWVTHMSSIDPRSPVEDASDFVPPLDAVDAAARIYDPILLGRSGRPVYGQLLKDYHSVEW
jgi:NAD(P)-dependent dehydrogenase (short-subunit alcohol dehydrogenase family)